MEEISLLKKLKSLHWKIDFFTVGLLFIPFDNLFFAPSAGWATIAPFFFCAYILQNIKLIKKIIDKEKKFIIALAAFAIYQVILIFINGLHIRALIDTVGTLGLGLSFFFSLVIRYEIRNEALMNEDGKKLFVAYVCSFIYGLIRLFAMNFSEMLLKVFTLIEKRPYARLAFSFTEPSFTAIHIIGVLFLFSYLVTDRKLAKKMFVLGVAFLVLQVLLGGSTRALIDIFVLLALFVVRWGFRKPKRIVVNISMLITIGVIISVIIFSSVRVRSILEQGVYADPSLASRFFRINAMCQGFWDKPINTLFGFGVGNMIIPFKSGYEAAVSTYASPYWVEVLELGQAQEIDSLFCMFVKVVSDCGLILTVLIFAYIIKKFIYQKLDIFVLLMVFWLCAQFDSYAFYTVWLILFLCKYYNKDKYGDTFMGFFVEEKLESVKNFVVRRLKTR